MFKGISLSGFFDYKVSPTLPIYVESGFEFANEKYHGASLDMIDGEFIGTVGAENEGHWIHLSVPVNVNYAYSLGNGFSLNPYLGTSVRFNVMAEGKYIDDDGTYKFSFLDKEEMDDGQWRKIQLIGNVGCNLFYQRYFIGYVFQWEYVGLTKYSKTKLNGITTGLIF